VKTAFVLGGGGVLGAHEVGILRALSEAGIRPDVVVGTSVGAINGAFVAADPAGAAALLGRLWQGEALRGAFSETVWGRAVRLARSGTHLHSIEPLRQLLNDMLPGDDFADLELPFHCVAASIEHARARWFSSGPIVPAVLASCAVPGLLPPVAVDGEHYFDGGLVDSIPVGRAIALGALVVYVLHVGRIERPLTVPRRPWEVGLAVALGQLDAAAPWVAAQPDERQQADQQPGQQVEGPGQDMPRGDDERDDEQRGEDAVTPAPRPAPLRRPGCDGRLAAGQVVEQPAEVRAGSGVHRLIDALVELGLAEPSLAIVLGQEVSDLGALGVRDPEIAGICSECVHVFSLRPGPIRVDQEDPRFDPDGPAGRLRVGPDSQAGATGR
jgi:NTE family protein